MRKKKGFRIRKALFILCAVLLLVTAGAYALTVTIYNESFNVRFQSYEPLMLRVEDFDGLERTQYRFPSDRGQQLTGYLYSAGESPRGLLVMAHGFGGGGHNSYMDCADFFARRGYLVFAYDATGNDESDGEGVGGLPQGVIDLDHALSFVKQCEDIPDLPIVLFGHSWGGYSACSVLAFHPDVKAVISCSGFNDSAGMFEAEGQKLAGDGAAMLLPFFNLHERLKYGGYASASAMNGFAASDAAVLILHSADDDVVPPPYGIDIYSAAYGDDPRFTFIRAENRGHGYVYHDTTYLRQFNAELDAWLQTLPYDPEADANKERFAADKADYIRLRLDRTKWASMLDTDLLDRFAAFYDAHLE
ncbi:MAG: alpha/beta fold hydrolase [Clostridia bacterium]|nr:alpha/beta fold hydrolase [Clostridia bacterium]